MAKSIMIQGTASNAGKSLLTAGLCRIFRQDGYRTAPFKSQNMALNSFVTADGLEMGRAQVMQAECAGISPDVRMNPILLKPVSENGSQVIVNGEVVGTMRAKEYYAYKERLFAPVMEAYNSLASEYDVIVLEGAGSPAEINLKQNDLVNMGMAKMADAPVLLVGDIDRGGVFASLAGTLLLLDGDERARIKGVIINKFRGDREILEPGLRMLTDIIKKPVLGVVPYIRIDVDDEDSLSARLQADAPPGPVDIAVIRFPRLSNFTDFNALSAVNGVTLRYIGSVRELKNPDLIILPGTKNTMGDLLWLRQCGLEAEILKYASTGRPVFGICGGYQMLGECLRDPQNLEHGGEMAGLGLLRTETVFAPQKIRRQTTGKFLEIKGIFSRLSGLTFTGYEIHMGKTSCRGNVDFLTETAAAGELPSPDGLVAGNIYGCYVHGIFDSPAVCAVIARALAESKGLDPGGLSIMDGALYRERQYDLLADTLRASLDMAQVYEILEGGGA